MFAVLLGVSLLVWYSLITSAEIASKETIFNYDYCEMKCGRRTHTMCVNPNMKPRCNPFEYFSFQKFGSNMTLMKILVDGHNGLRSRIADRMRVSNMLELTWDKKLAQMALNFLFRCDEQGRDPCTLSTDVILESDIMIEFYKTNKTTPQISQNTYREETNFYPYKFLERMIQNWYFEKEIMEMPIYESTDSGHIGRLRGENNFTHFAFPLSYRFGCAMAKFHGSYHVACNYFPHFRTVTNVVYFSSGKPASECPPRFPLEDDMYSNLCTDQAGSYFDRAAGRDPLKALIIIVLLMILGT